MKVHCWLKIMSSMLLLLAAGCSQSARPDAGPDRPRYCEGGIGMPQENGICAGIPGGWPCIFVTVSAASTRQIIPDARVWVERRLPMGDVGIAPREELQFWVVNVGSPEAYYLTTDATNENWCAGEYTLSVDHPNYQSQSRIGLARVDRPMGANNSPDRYDFVLTPR